MSTDQIRSPEAEALIKIAAEFFEQATNFAPLEFLQQLSTATEIAISIKLKPFASLHITAGQADGNVARFDLPVTPVHTTGLQ